MAGPWTEHADVPPEIQQALPRGYDVVGSVAIIRLPEDLDLSEDHKAAVGRALLDGVPNAQTAAVDWGVEGTVRAREIEVLAGTPELLTDHKENGCRLLVDLATCYYSPRLAGERARIAELVQEGEHVLDMYTGVGPYAVLIARETGNRVVGLEVNPRAADLSRQNARRNKVGELVDVVIADAPQLTRAMPARFDRVIMNLPHDAVEHVAAVLPACRPGAVLHVGAMLAKDDVDDQAPLRAEAHGLDLVDVVKVRNYNPAVGHYCLEMRVPGREEKA